MNVYFSVFSLEISNSAQIPAAAVEIYQQFLRSFMGMFTHTQFYEGQITAFVFLLLDGKLGSSPPHHVTSYMI